MFFIFITDMTIFHCKGRLCGFNASSKAVVQCAKEKLAVQVQHQ